MLRLWSSPVSGQDPISDGELARAYAYPDDLDRPYLRVNFVTSLDGAVAVDGTSGGLASGADRRVFGLLRELCEVIVIGAGTARAENYRGARRPSRATGSPPPIAVITSTADLDPAAALFTDTSVPPLILTGHNAPDDNRRKLADAGAEVLVVDGDQVTPAVLLAALRDRGLHRVLCEGGPRLFGGLIAADAVDELCLTVFPALAAGSAGRIAAGPSAGLRGMRLTSALTEDDVLLLRYRRDR